MDLPTCCFHLIYRRPAAHICSLPLSFRAESTTHRTSYTRERAPRTPSPRKKRVGPGRLATLSSARLSHSLTRPSQYANPGRATRLSCMRTPACFSLSLFPIYSVQVPTTYKLSRAALRRLRCSLIRGQSAWRSRWPRPSGQARTGCRRGCRRRCASPGARSHTASRSRRARGGRA